MIFKILLIASGDEFRPDSILNLVKGNFLVTDKNDPGDQKFENKNDAYEFGSLTFWHPKKFSIEDNVVEYEKWFVEFLETNHKLFYENGARDFELFMEIYYDSGQCNFQIFDRELLKRLTQFNISIPISIYTLSDDKFQQWSNEIKLSWQ